MRKKIVAGNWKMHGCKTSIHALLDGLGSGLVEKPGLEVLVFPPSIYIPLVSAYAFPTKLNIGGQNLHPRDSGAFTGELSALMLKDYGCSYVLVGHSERRHLFHENQKFLAEKFHSVKEHAMIPVLCVGETQEERAQGKTQAVLAEQIQSVADGFNGTNVFADCVIAYEPVWAIGSSSPATAEQAQEAHAYIRSLLGAKAKEIPIIYGGSLTRYNAKALFAMPDVDGGLVGGASLDASQFVDIVKCIN